MHMQFYLLPRMMLAIGERVEELAHLGGRFLLAFAEAGTHKADRVLRLVRGLDAIDRHMDRRARDLNVEAGTQFPGGLLLLYKQITPDSLDHFVSVLLVKRGKWSTLPSQILPVASIKLHDLLAFRQAWPPLFIGLFVIVSPQIFKRFLRGRPEQLIGGRILGKMIDVAISILPWTALVALDRRSAQG